jgi:hypothetical protein
MAHISSQFQRSDHSRHHFNMGRMGMSVTSAISRSELLDVAADESRIGSDADKRPRGGSPHPARCARHERMLPRKDRYLSRHRRPERPSQHAAAVAQWGMGEFR